MQIHELDLDGVKCLGEIDFGDLQFDNLETLTLTRANLTSLKNLPTFPSLVKVRLSAEKYENIFSLKYFLVGSLSQPTVQRTGDLERLQTAETPPAAWKQIQTN